LGGAANIRIGKTRSLGKAAAQLPSFGLTTLEYSCISEESTQILGFPIVLQPSFPCEPSIAARTTGDQISQKQLKQSPS